MVIEATDPIARYARIGIRAVPMYAATLRGAKVGLEASRE